MKYVLGFYFDVLRTEVALIQHLETGKLNGLGGKIESGETAHDAMVREFREEGGITVPAWRPYCRMAGSDWSVDCLTSSGWGVPTEQREGNVRMYPIDVLMGRSDLRSNVLWLVHLALDKGDGAGMPQATEVCYP